MLTLPSSNEQFGELDGQHIPRELHENNWDKKDKIGWLVKGIKSCSSGAPFLPPSDLQSPEMHSLTSGRSGEQMEGPCAQCRRALPPAKAVIPEMAGRTIQLQY